MATSVMKYMSVLQEAVPLRNSRQGFYDRKHRLVLRNFGFSVFFFFNIEKYNNKVCISWMLNWEVWWYKKMKVSVREGSGRKPGAQRQGQRLRKCSDFSWLHVTPSDVFYLGYIKCLLKNQACVLQKDKEHLPHGSTHTYACEFGVGLRTRGCSLLYRDHTVIVVILQHVVSMETGRARCRQVPERGRW